MNKNDLRYIKTEQIIRKSFIDCVNSHGFEKTTVSMICEAGLISRNAFYLHFTDKYDLLDRFFDEFRSALINSYGQIVKESVFNNDVLSSTKIYAETLIENRAEFLFLIKCSRDRMDNVIKEIIIDFPNRTMISDYEEKCKDIKIQLNIKYMFTAMVAYTELWFENFDKISKDDAIFELYNFCEKSTTFFYNHIYK